MKYKAAVTLLLGFFSTAAIAQDLVPVVDLSSPAPTNNSAQNADVVTTTDLSGQGDRYYQMQVLQEEVRMLRGMVEELNYELQQVKQRQMDDYLDIDRRLSALAAGFVAPTNDGALSADQSMGAEANSGFDAAVSAGQPGVTGRLEESDGFEGSGEFKEPVTVSPVDVAVMKANYDNASNLLLKQRDMDGAVLAFQQHIADYPDSPYAANAHYWLGEIYLLKGQDDLSREAFTAVIERHAGHSKAMDASFKLGKIYHQMGQVDRARELLEIAAQSTGGVASKARAYLSNNF
jgi:tol-pal system protein YbgF